MRELIYTEEEKRRLHDGILDYPKYPADIYHGNDFRYHSSKYEFLVFYPKYRITLFRVNRYITDIKNEIRKLIDSGSTEDEIEKAFQLLDDHIFYYEKCKKQFYEYLQSLSLLQQKYYKEDD